MLLNVALSRSSPSRRLLEVVVGVVLGEAVADAVGCTVGVGVADGDGVGSRVASRVGVAVGVGERVGLAVAARVAVEVGLGAHVDVTVGGAVAVPVGVSVWRRVGEGMAVAVRADGGTSVAVRRGEGAAVGVAVRVGVGAGRSVGDGVAVAEGLGVLGGRLSPGQAIRTGGAFSTERTYERRTGAAPGVAAGARWTKDACTRPVATTVCTMMVASRVRYRITTRPRAAQCRVAGPPNVWPSPMRNATLCPDGANTTALPEVGSA